MTRRRKSYSLSIVQSYKGIDIYSLESYVFSPEENVLYSVLG
jgi:hypothetical protein